MARGKTDWEDLAFDNGFKGDDKAMLTHWHHVDRLSQEAIAIKLDLSTMTVHHRMKFHNIERIRVPSNLASYGPRLPGWRK